MILELDSFEETAFAVFAMNPSAKQFNSAAGVQSFMESVAYQELTKPGFVGTLGFMLTAYQPSYGGDLRVRASVSAFLAKAYVARVQDIAAEFAGA